jgi:hypothetical protein
VGSGGMGRRSSWRCLDHNRVTRQRPLAAICRESCVNSAPSIKPSRRETLIVTGLAVACAVIVALLPGPGFLVLQGCGGCKLAARVSEHAGGSPRITHPVEGRQAKGMIYMVFSADSPVDAFLAAVERGAMDSCSVWAPDAVLDATVPNWRLRRSGPAAIRAEYRGWFADPGRFEQMRRMPIADGEVVQYFLTWVENGVPHAAHHVHILQVTQGKITSDTVVCGGRWPAGLLADIQAAQEEQDAHVSA